MPLLTPEDVVFWELVDSTFEAIDPMGAGTIRNNSLYLLELPEDSEVFSLDKIVVKLGTLDPFIMTEALKFCGARNIIEAKIKVDTDVLLFLYLDPNYEMNIETFSDFAAFIQCEPFVPRNATTNESHLVWLGAAFEPEALCEPVY